MNSRVLSNNMYMLARIIRLIPGYAIASIILTISGSCVTAYAEVNLLKNIINSLQEHKPAAEILAFILAVMAVYAVQKGLEAFFTEHYSQAMLQRLGYKLQLSLFEKARQIGLEHYDNPEFYNDFILAMSNADTKSIEVFNTIREFISKLSTVTALVALIASIGGIGLIFAVINVLAAFYINILTAKASYAKQMEMVEHNRRHQYIDRV
ncbi:MAG TPA: hypothetical protein PLZ84_09610, partial [Clostridia bacterium]|nr:hypothetical protein [Clostridia bacterium]